MSNFASAQLSKAKIAEFLTNDSIRAWQFKEIRQSLGSSNCKGDGLTLIFNKNFQVTLKRCEKGKIIITKTTWAITVLNEEIREFTIKFNDSLKISDDYWLMNARIDLPYPGLKKRNKQLILRHIDTPVSQRRVREIITFLSLY